MEPGLLDEEANRRRHAHPPVLDLSGGRATHSLSAAPSSAGYRAAAAPTSAVRIHSYWVLPYGHMSAMPIGSQGLPPVSGPAPGSCLQAGGTRGGQHPRARKPEGGKGRGALERHLHVRPSRRRRRDQGRRLEGLHEGGGQDLPQQREWQGVSSGSACRCSDGTGALRAASQGVDPPPPCPPVPPPPQWAAAELPGGRACMLIRLKLREIPRYIIYPLCAMRVAVSSLALCGVSSAYQATTARTGALANQVTMMAKSKARPRSLTQPAAAPRSGQACDPAAHSEPLWSTGRADVRCA